MIIEWCGRFAAHQYQARGVVVSQGISSFTNFMDPALLDTQAFVGTASNRTDVGTSTDRAEVGSSINRADVGTSADRSEVG